ncbi:hypothetical protein SAMN06297422_10721 [Lachnospiraceae bacterium]|nr:hypothetical protein SAMN06297422_10721 [Lachnospiraceae bacterium]
MTNEQIIADVAVTSGLFTEAEIVDFIESGREIPLHTFQGWAARGNYRIKAGEHGIETRLWKKRKPNNPEKNSHDEKQEDDKGFYLTKAYLFSADQVEIREDIKCVV